MSKNDNIFNKSIGYLSIDKIEKKKRSKSKVETHYQSYSIKIVEYWAYFPRTRICNQETSEVI